jgi:hypothetical protein
MTSQLNEEAGPSKSVPTLKRLYEFWPGNNRFLLNGRVLLGPRADLTWVLGTWTVLFLVQVAFSVFVGPYLWTKVSVWLPVVSWHFFICTVLFILLTSLSDPGILPRKTICDLLGGTVPCVQGEATYCKECEIYRPKSARHCSRCNNCVLELDHHCPFLGSCIGKNNYQYFIAALVSVGLLGITDVFGIGIYIISDWSSGIHPKRVRKPHTVVEDDTLMWSIIITMGGLVMALTVFATVLCLFHLQICVRTAAKFSCCSTSKSVIPWRAQVVTTITS